MLAIPVRSFLPSFVSSFLPFIDQPILPSFIVQPLSFPPIFLPSASVDAMIKGADVVIAAAGPFLQCGLPIVDACVRHGCHYVDICGEVPFVKTLVEVHHDRCKVDGTKIVPMCGFDSIPSDLAAFSLARHIAQNTSGGAVGRIFNHVNMKGSFSGGTIATTISLENAPLSTKKMMLNPYALGGVVSAKRESDIRKPQPSESLAQCWVAPFVMANVNTRIVRRTSMLLEQAGDPLYGPQFSYQEASLFPDEIAALLHHEQTPLAGQRQGLVEAGKLPRAGDGPSDLERANSWFRMTLVGESADKSYRSVATIAGGDPGYSETAKMVCEAALCLLDDLKTKERQANSGGVLTPVVAFQDSPLMETLVAKGLDFEVRDFEGFNIQAAFAPPAGVANA
jgi:short subunit dehydrogenase-like uncharacterized protein